MVHFYCAEYGEDVLLRPLHRYDIEYLRQWRNNKELCPFLTNIGEVTIQIQEKWFDLYIHDKDVLFFVIDYKRIRTVGSIALYNFQNNKCQIGKIIVGEGKARGHNIGRKSFLMAMCVGIKYLGIREFGLSVHENNNIARNIYEKIGFRINGRHSFATGGTEFEMTITVDEILNKNKEVDEILLFEENDKTMKTFNVR